MTRDRLQRSIKRRLKEVQEEVASANDAAAEALERFRAGSSGSCPAPIPAPVDLWTVSALQEWVDKVAANPHIHACGLLEPKVWSLRKLLQKNQAQLDDIIVGAAWGELFVQEIMER